MFSSIPTKVLVLILLGCTTSVLAQSRSVTVEQHYQRARDALAQHDLQRASQEYEEILKLDPQDVEILTAHGMTMYGLGKPSAAAASLKAALSLSPSQSKVELFLSLSQADLGQCTEAAPLLRKHFKQETETKLRRLAGISLLSCHLATSELDQAVEFGRMLKQSFPDDPDVLYHLASVYSRLWNQTISEMVAKSPDSFRVHQVAGEALETQGKHQQAIKEYRRAVELNPKAPHLHYRIGRLLLADGKDTDTDKKALESFQQELAVNPQDALTHHEMGEIFRRNRDSAAARTHYQQAIELSAQLVEARVGLGKLYLAEQQPEKALKELEQAVRQDPRNAQAHYALMLAYRDLGRTGEAQKEFAVFQGLEKEKAQSFNTLLQSLLTGGTRPSQ
jgi:tetratricopeptide (TPR) repeat protein